VTNFRYRFGSDCPICAGDRKDCRENTVNQLIHCRSGANPPPGWKFLGEDQIGFGIYGLDKGEFSQADIDRYRQEQEQAKQERLAKAKDSLPNIERDRHYKRIARSLGLGNGHRQKLLDRGLLPAEIDLAIAQGWLSSWEPGADIGGLPSALAGIDPKSGRLRGTQGIAIYAQSLEGHSIGGQIGADDRSRAKYLWISSASVGGCGPQLQSGEIPHFIWRSPNFDPSQPATIHLCEGALKSSIAALKHWRSGNTQAIWIGAAGGNFKGLAGILEAMPRIAKATLYPDAGAIANSQILRNYEAAIAQISGECAISWWGQAAKSQHPDIDELADWGEIRHLSPTEFWALCPAQSQSTGFAAQELSNIEKRDLQIAQRAASFQKALPLLKRDHSLSEAEKRQIQYYEGFAPTLDLSLDTILLSGKFAAGKTEAILRSLISRKNQQIIWITGRNGLLRDTARRAEEIGFDCFHYQDDVALNRQLLQSGQPGIYFMADESLKPYHVGGLDLSAATVVIDEFSAVRREIIGKPLLIEFERLLAQCKNLIVADAFLGDIDCRIISKYRKGKRQILNQAPGKHSKKINWVETRTKEGALALSHDGIVFDILEKQFLPGAVAGCLPYVVATDALLAAQNIKDWAIDQGIPKDKILLLSSITPEISKELLSAGDSEIAKRQPWLILATPTIESGVDFQSPIRGGLALFFGVIQPTQALQIPGRFRNCPEWYFSAPRRAIDSDFGYLSETKLQKIIRALPEAFSEIGAEANKPADGWAAWERELQPVARAFNSEYIYHLLEQNYETVERIEYKADRTLWKKYTAATKQREAKLCLCADLERGQRLLAEQKAPALDSDIWAIKLAIAHQQAPKIWDCLIRDYPQQPEEVVEVARAFLSGRAIAKLKRYILASNPSAEHDWRDFLQRGRTNYASPYFQSLQYRELFRRLNLEALAKRARGDKTISHQNSYAKDSEPITNRYQQFQQCDRLIKLNPGIDSLEEFWRLLKRVMRWLGFQPIGQNCRVACDRPIPNGKNRDGSQRYSKSISLYFVGWLLHAESGSKVFRENYPTIYGAILELIERERVDIAAKQREIDFQKQSSIRARAA
jgi:hypothetical protein